MRITTTKSALLNATLIAERIAGKKESLPVLSCILIDASKELILKSTNLEAGIEVSVPADVEEKGILAVPAGILSQTLRSIHNDKVVLKSEEGNLIVESKGTKTLIKALPHDEFPALPSADGKRGITLLRDSFLLSLRSVLYAASPSMIRPELGSVFVTIKSPSITTVATDSFRLAEKTISGVTSKESAELLVPLKHGAELIYILERLDEDDVDVVAEESQMIVMMGPIRYISRVIDAQFPNYRDIIPKGFVTEATVLKAEFADMLKKGRVFSGNDQHIGLHIYPKKKIFSATARSAEVGEMSDSIDAALSGEDLDINFHIGYLSDCLSIIESDSITLQFAGVGRPLVIKGTSDASFTYLVMPLNR